MKTGNLEEELENVKFNRLPF